jgi:hypothetical protein
MQTNMQTNGNKHTVQQLPHAPWFLTMLIVPGIHVLQSMLSGAPSTSRSSAVTCGCVCVCVCVCVVNIHVL